MSVIHRVFFEYGGQVVQLPANPEEITLKRHAENETAEVLQLGQINQLTIPNLSECVIEAFLPVRPNGSFVNTNGNFRQPAFYRDLFNRIMTDRRQCRLVVTGTNINMAVSIESFEFTHKYAEGEIYFALELKEFRSHSAREVRINVTPPRPAQPPRPRATTTPARPASTNRTVTVGARVRVNGRLHRDSFGNGGGLTEQNAIRVVNIIAPAGNPNQTHRYHVALVGGGNRGWVRSRDVTLI